VTPQGWGVNDDSAVPIVGTINMCGDWKCG